MVDISFIVLSINVEMSSVHLVTVTSFYNSYIPKSTFILCETYNF